MSKSPTDAEKAAMDRRMAEHEQKVRPVSLRAQHDARKYGSTKPRGDSESADQRGGAPVAPPRADPESHPQMFPGLVGDVARAATRKSDVSPVAVAAGFLSFLGAMAGRDVYLSIGQTRHHPRLYTLHIGRSSVGGKGDAMRITHDIRKAVAKTGSELVGQTHAGGLSSREGLAFLIHDGFTVGKETTPPVLDKRLWVIEDEFVNVLSQGRRDGNTLSAALRVAWDGDSIQPATKSARGWATDPHLGIAASITPCELHAKLRAGEVSNGFANRFLMFWAERPYFEPDPQPAPREVLAGLADRTAEVLRFIKGNYPQDQDTREMHLSCSARALWVEAFHNLRFPLESEMLSALLVRRAPYCKRLAMLFALCEGTLVIEDTHLRAALAWIDYSCASVRYVFGIRDAEFQIQAFLGMRAQILDFLAMRPEGATKVQISNECFSRHRTEVPIDEVLRRMLADPQCGMETEELPRQDGKAGRGARLYRLHEKSVRSLRS